VCRAPICSCGAQSVFCDNTVRTMLTNLGLCHRLRTIPIPMTHDMPHSRDSTANPTELDRRCAEPPYMYACGASSKIVPQIHFSFGPALEGCKGQLSPQKPYVLDPQQQAQCDTESGRSGKSVHWVASSSSALKLSYILIIITSIAIHSWCTACEPYN
jgi:hypothetical protein